MVQACCCDPCAPSCDLPEHVGSFNLCQRNTYIENATCWFIYSLLFLLGPTQDQPGQTWKTITAKWDIRSPLARLQILRLRWGKWRSCDRNVSSQSYPSPGEEGGKSSGPFRFITHRKKREDSQSAWSLWEITYQPFSWANTHKSTLRGLSLEAHLISAGVIYVHLTMKAFETPKWWLV